MLVDLYKPINYIIEPQIDFNHIAEENKVSRRYLDTGGALGSWSLDSKEGSGYV